MFHFVILFLTAMFLGICGESMAASTDQDNIDLAKRFFPARRGWVEEELITNAVRDLTETDKASVLWCTRHLLLLTPDMDGVDRADIISGFHQISPALRAPVCDEVLRRFQVAGAQGQAQNAGNRMLQVFLEVRDQVRLGTWPR